MRDLCDLSDLSCRVRLAVDVYHVTDDEVMISRGTPTQYIMSQGRWLAVGVIVIHGGDSHVSTGWYTVSTQLP